MNKSYIVFLEQVEQIEEGEEGIQVVLDGIEKKLFEEINENNIFENEFMNRIPTQIFTASLEKKYLLISEDSSWYEITVTNYQTNIPIQLYTDVFFNEEPVQLFIEDIKPMRIDNKKKIFSMDVFPESNKTVIQNTLDTHNNFENSVVVYNVGQGNCNSVCDSSGMPIMYFDFGGGVFQNTKTYPGNFENPTPITFCYTERPPVLLSHWDWDHMASIRKNEHSKIKQSKWIVPKQEIGISHLKVAVELFNNGNLIIWPNSETAVKTRSLEVQKISTNNLSDKNNNGLVLTIELKNDNLVLLPGDCNYDLINQKTNYSGLVATHHGATSHGCLNQIPQATQDGKIAYSFGAKNSFKHPKTPSISEHVAKGWTDIKLTVNGHVSLGQVEITTMPCENLCTLGDTQ